MQKNPKRLGARSIERIAQAAGGLRRGRTHQNLEKELSRAARVYEFWQPLDKAPTRLQRLNSLKRIKNAADRMIAALETGGEIAVDELRKHDGRLDFPGTVGCIREITICADVALKRIKEDRMPLWREHGGPTADIWLSAECLPIIYEKFTGRNFGVTKDHHKDTNQPGGPGIDFVQTVYRELGLDVPSPDAIEKRWDRFRSGMGQSSIK